MTFPADLDDGEYLCWFCRKGQCGRCRDEQCVCCAGNTGDEA